MPVWKGLLRMTRSNHALFRILLLLVIAKSQLIAQQGYGEVSFANSGPAAAQADFLPGLAQLHDFEYSDAAESFRKAESIAPNFAMAYWGEAMTKNHPVWHQQDLAGARAVLARLGPTPVARLAKAPSEREKLYLNAVEVLYGDGTKAQRDLKYEAAMAELYKKYPDDVNAAAFYALSILGTAEHGRDFATYMRAAAVLEGVFPQNRQHPGVLHYMIHCYDDPIHAPLGLRPARLYAQVAPQAAHAQHMTSHIFLAMGMWDDVVKANETATAVVNRKRQAAGKPPSTCGHYNYWLEYGYLQQGRVDMARKVLEGCRTEAEGEATRIARSKTPDPDDSAVGSYSVMRARFVIDTQLWNDAILQWTLPPGDFQFARFTQDYTDAFAALRRSDVAASRPLIVQAQADQKAAEEALKKEPNADAQDKTRLDILIQQLNALLLADTGKDGDALQELQRTQIMEAQMPLEFGPPFVDKPTAELLGEELLKNNRPSDAVVAFQEALARAPGRKLSVTGLATAESESNAAEAGANLPQTRSNGSHH